MTATVVAISGPSGSGKSSLVNAIVHRLTDAHSLRFDDYKESTQFPDDLAHWVRNGCDPNEISTPKMVEDIRALRNQNTSNKWIVVEEPFGRNRRALAPFIDCAICIDIPLDIAFARTIKRAALSVPEGVDVPSLLRAGAVIENFPS